MQESPARKWARPLLSTAGRIACLSPLCGALVPERASCAAACPDCGFDGSHDVWIAARDRLWAIADKDWVDIQPAQVPHGR